MFFSGKLKLNDEFQRSILDALITKDGLVPDSKKDAFRSKLKAWTFITKDYKSPKKDSRKSLIDGVLNESMPSLKSALDRSRSKALDDSDNEDQVITLGDYEGKKPASILDRIKE